jgi:hypothetical protein
MRHTDGMTGRPESSEAVPYYFTYIDQVPGDDVVRILASQLDKALALFRSISKEKSLYRYAPDKWSVRQVLNHISDTERVFVFRAFWFARGLDSPLPDFDQAIAATGGRADGVSWARHVEEFRRVRLATLVLFENLPEDAWMRTGIASGNHFTVRALAWIAAGHFAHHFAILRERYL